MSQQDVLIPKMKRIDKKQNKIRLPFLNLLLVLCALLLIVSSTFIGFDLKHYIIPVSFWSDKNLNPDEFVKSFYMIPQIPVIMFVCSVLEKKMAVLSVALYLILGIFFFPFFALGGGIHYFSEYSFGYLLSYLPAALIATSFLNKKRSFFNMFLAALCGVLVIHVCGFLYMLIIALFKHDGIPFISGWITYQSGIKIVYDFILSYVLILIGKYIYFMIRFLAE